MYLHNIFFAAFTVITAVSSYEAGDDGPAKKYIITLKQDVEPSAFDAHLQWASDLHKDSLRKRNEKGIDKIWKHSFKGYSAELDQETAQSLLQNKDVLDVEPVGKFRAASDGKPGCHVVTQENAPWNLGSISHRTPNWTEYLYHNSAGKDTFAYVVDSGVYLDHAEFEGRAFFGYDALPDDREEDFTHGTHVAGIIAGRDYGVAKKANIISVRVLAPGLTDTDQVIDGIEWAVEDILSKGRAGNSVLSLAFTGELSQAVNLAVSKAYDAGVLSIAAAGDWGYNANRFSPASEPKAFTVTSSDERNVRVLFANWGARVDIFAPGTNIISAYPGNEDATQVLSGTSFSAAHVVGLALYLKALEGSPLDSPGAATARIKELGTRDVLDDVPQETVNLLTYNGIEEYLEG